MPVTVQGCVLRFAPPPGAAALIGDFTDWQRGAPLPASGALRVTVPRDSLTEFAWVDAQGQPFADPEAENLGNPWWPYARGVRVGRPFAHPLWQGAVNAPERVVHRLSWEGRAIPGARRAVVVLPAGYAGENLPVYYVQDGVAFWRIGRLAEALGRAAARGEAREAALVFVEPRDRDAEYALDGAYLELLLREVMPRVEGELLPEPGRAERGLWGASLGGLISLHAATRHPELFGRVVTHSAALAPHPRRPTRLGGLPGTVAALPALWDRLAGLQDVRIAADTGVLEWLLPANRRLAALLAEAELPHQYREYQSGHTWLTWREAVPEALLYMQGCDPAEPGRGVAE